MLLRLGRATLWAVLGYVSAAVLTYGLTMWLSSNTHDRQMEAGMTAAFVVGPAVGLLGFLIGLRRR